MFGSDAAAFLATAGWNLTSDPSRFRFVGDLIRNERFVVGRHWHSAAEFDFSVRRELHSDGRLMLIAGLEGELTFAFPDHEEVVSPGKIMLARPDSYSAASCKAPVSVMFIIMSDQDFADDVLIAAGQASPDYLPVLIAVTNSFLNQKGGPDDAGFARVERALEDLTVAVAAESDLSYVYRLRDERRQTYLRAITLIAAEASNSRATVDTITQKLGVSRSRLFAAFQVTGDTPAKYLRRARLKLAQARMEAGDTERDAALKSGFGSVRRLRSAQPRSERPEVLTTAPNERELLGS